MSKNDTTCRHCHDHNHGHSNGHHDHTGHWWSHFIPESITLVLFIATLLIPWENDWIRLTAYIVALTPVGIPILRSTIREWRHGDIFNEFTLMVLASVGAFIIGEYPEGVAVLLFYSIGEKLEDVVSGDVKGQIKRLLGKMPKHATVIENGQRRTLSPEQVKPGMVIAVKPGENVPLDGELISDEDTDFNTAAITGESLPRTYGKGMAVTSGIIPLDREVLIKVTHAWNDSSMTRIMQMIEDASAHRAPSETILRRITRWYTPMVFAAAVLLFIIPWTIGLINPAFDFEWSIWLRRSLVFLVCSCPCALIVSIPLTYFTSIGIASKKGILFKGHDNLDYLRNADTVMFDKTGTVTTGEFHVGKVTTIANIPEEVILGMTASVEQKSTHPLAHAIVAEARSRGISLPEASDVKSVEHGMTAKIQRIAIGIGSARFMQKNGIDFTGYVSNDTSVLMAVDGKPAAVIELEDTVKPGVREAISELHRRGIKQVGILSGDSAGAVEKAASEVGADINESELLPDDKLRIIKDIRREGQTVAYAGDGVNDAPALAAANIGIAMGNLGTDIAIESAGVVIAGDDLRKISEGIDISRRVKHVIIENVTFAFGVKLLVMILGAFGIATLWAAVFADTGVTVITILWTLYRLKIWQLRKNSTK